MDNGFDFVCYCTVDSVTVFVIFEFMLIIMISNSCHLSVILQKKFAFITCSDFIPLQQTIMSSVLTRSSKYEL